MSNEIIILQIMFIALGMVLFSSLFNKIFGIKLKDMKELQEKSFNMQERMRNAQELGDREMMQELQLESMTLMKTMMTKQFMPMCARCIVFMIIFAVIGFFYAPYDFWFATYFLFSLLFSFSAMGLKYAYKRVTHKEDKTKSSFRELMGIPSLNQGGTGEILQVPRPIQIKNPEEETPLEGTDSWKDRIS